MIVADTQASVPEYTKKVTFSTARVFYTSLSQAKNKVLRGKWDDFHYLSIAGFTNSVILYNIFGTCPG